MCKVLVLPANDADPGHMKAVTNILSSTSVEIVRWSQSLRESDYDYSILIPGRKNEDFMYDVWLNADIDTKDLSVSSLNMDHNTDNTLYLGRGLYSHIEDASKPVYVLSGAEDPEENEDYMGEDLRCGPLFFQVNSSDITGLGRNYNNAFGCINKDKLDGKDLYLLPKLVEKQSKVVGNTSSSWPSFTHIASKPDKDGAPSTNLLLLRRVRV